MRTLSILREAAHSLIAVLGAIAVSGSLILGLLSVLGVHGVDVQVVEFTGLCGSIGVLLSKGIDSANNVFTAMPTTASPPSSPTPCRPKQPAPP